MSENITTGKNCSNCRAVLDTDAVFCNECGSGQAETAKTDTKTCPRCGREIKQGNKFCPGCAFDFFSPPVTSEATEAGVAKTHPAPPPASQATETRTTTDATYQVAATHPAPPLHNMFANTNTQTAAPAEPLDRLSSLKKRYKDGYRVATAIEGFGLVLKIVGLVVGALIASFGLIVGLAAVEASRNSMFNNGGGMNAFIYSVFLFLIIGGTVTAVSWILGVMISAQGQLLKANLDCAVNSSPFLTDLSKAEIMALPSN
jgi:RNA polymerase subunit RPABC4/transcription elongation factor Spt4